MWNILFVWLLLNVVVCTICLQQRVLLLARHGVHLPCILFVNYLLAVPFSINLVPIMSLRFLFRRKAKIGGFRNISARFGFICRRCQCFITISFILGTVLLYLSDKEVFVSVSFFFSFKSCYLSCKLALLICCSINNLSYPPFWNWLIIFAVWLKNSCCEEQIRFIRKAWLYGMLSFSNFGCSDRASR